MAKIQLNVDIDKKAALKKLDELKGDFEKIAESLDFSKNAKELTAAIEKLATVYKDLAEAAKKVSTATGTTRKNIDDTGDSAEKQSKKLYGLEERLAKLSKSTEDVSGKTKTMGAALKDVGEETEEAWKAVRAFNETGEDMGKTAKEMREETQRLSATTASLQKEYNAAAKAETEAAKSKEEHAKALQKAKEQYTSTEKALHDLSRSIKEVESQYPAGTFDALKTSVGNALTQLEGLSTRSRKYISEVDKLSGVQKNLATEFSKTRDETEKLDGSYEKAEERMVSLDTKLYNLLKRISNEENRYDNGVFDGLKEKISALIVETENLDKTDANFVEREKELEKKTADVVNELVKVEATANHAAPAVSTLGEKFGNLVERYAKFYASSLLVRKPLEMIKNALGEVGETLVKTEDAVIELQRVLDGTIPQSKEISDALYNLAYEYGQTFENASTLASNFARSGKTWTESLEATEAALLAMNVAELNATSASDGLLSIIQQFGMETGELLTIVDKLNKVADKNPVTTGKLLEAIKRSGSAAKNANISFDETLALITSISEATNRSGQNIGTAINSLIQYSSKNVDVFAKLSDEAEDVVERFKIGAASIAEVWKQVAEDIHNDKEMRDALLDSLGTDGMEELASTLHDELGDLVSEIDGVYNVANTYRKNYFVALLDNMFDTEENGETVLGRFSKVLQDLQDVQDYSHKENDRYMETYTAKVNQLQAAWQKLANDEQGILGLKKTLAEIGIGIVNFVESSGGIVATVSEIAAGVGGLVLTLKSAKIADGVISLWKSLKATWEAAKALVLQMVGVKTATDSATASAVALQGAFAWVGVAIIAINAVVGAVRAYNAEQEKARQYTIAAWKEQKEQVDKIEELLEKLNNLNRDSEEYRDTEAKIVDLLGDKKTLLGDLTEGTEEYSQKVRELTQAEIEYEKAQRVIAQKAAKESFDKAVYNQLGKISFKDYAMGAGSYKEISEGYFKFNSANNYNLITKLKEDLQEVTEEYAKLLSFGQEIPNSLQHRYDMLSRVWDAVKDEYEAYKVFIDEETAQRKEATKAAEEYNAALEELIRNNPKYAKLGLENLSPEEIGSLRKEVEALNEVARASKEAVVSLGPEPTGAKDAASIFDSLTRAAKEYVKDLETVHDAQKEYAENGKVSASTMEKLLSLGDAYRNAIFDETGKLDLNSEALQKLNKDRENFLTAHGYIIPALEEEIEKVDENTEAINKELNAVDKKIKFATQYKNEIETVNKAQAEYTATGKLSAQTIHDLLSLDEKLVDLMRDENGQLNVNSERLAKVLKIRENYVLNQGMVIENTKEEIKLLDEELDKLKDTISLRKSELTIYEKSGVSMGEREAKMREIIADIGDEIAYLERTQEIVDGVGSKQEEINRLKAEQLDYEEKITSMYEKSAEEQKKLLEEQQKAAEKAAKEAEQAEKERLKAIEDAQKAQIAAYDAEINLYNSKISLSEAENGTVEERVGYYEQIKEILQEKIEYLELLGGREAEINELKVDQYEIEEKIAKLKEDEIERLQQEELAVITDEIDLLESRLKIAEQTYGAEEERITILASINALLGQQIQYLISIGATELEINKIKSEQLGIQAQILALEQQSLMLVQNAELGAIQDELDALLNGVEIEEKSLDLTEQQIDLEKDRSAELKKAAELEEQIAKAKLEYIESVIDAYMKSEKSADSLAEKQEAVQNAREKLEQARRDSVAKALEAAYKKQNDSASDALDLEEKRLAVEKARVALTAAENDKTVRVYNEESGEWERQADAKKVQDAKEAFNDAVRALNDFVEEQAWDEVIAAVENGSISGSRMNAILDKWAAANYGEGTPEFIAKIKAVYKQSLGHIDEDDSVIGAEKNVEKAVKSLNDYLKSEAINELKEYLEAGNRDTEGMNAILDKWMGLGEGGEMYTWRTGLLDVVTEAIESNYYDDSKIRSSIEDTTTKIKETTTAVHGTTAEVKKLNTTFVTEIRQAAKNSSEAVAAVIAKYQDSVDARFIEWANDVLTTKQEYEEREAYYTEKQANGLTQAEIDKFTAEMIENSKAWASADEAERKRLEERNLALGSLLGWKRDDDSGVWYNSEGKRAYDNGGVLRGIGGIKATEKPEIVLDPNLTEKILRPNSEAQFRAFADALGLIFEHGDRIGASSKPIINGQRYSDSHNVSTVINGVPIPSHVADNYTIAELARMIPAV